jgi:hypothetical protein
LITKGDFWFWLIIKHFWLLCLLALFLIAGFEEIYILFVVKKHPELKEGYNKLIVGIITAMGFPWLVMGIGVLTQNIPSLLFYFMIWEGNPFVSAFFISIILECLIYLIWIWLGDGVSFLQKHPTLFFNPKSSPLMKKIFSLMLFVGGAFGIFFLWVILE